MCFNLLVARLHQREIVCVAQEKCLRLELLVLIPKFNFSLLGGYKAT